MGRELLSITSLLNRAGDRAHFISKRWINCLKMAHWQTIKAGKKLVFSTLVCDPGLLNCPCCIHVFCCRLLFDDIAGFPVEFPIRVARKTGGTRICYELIAGEEIA